MLVDDVESVPNMRAAPVIGPPASIHVSALSPTHPAEAVNGQVDPSGIDEVDVVQLVAKQAEIVPAWASGPTVTPAVWVLVTVALCVERVVLPLTSTKPVGIVKFTV